MKFISLLKYLRFSLLAVTFLAACQPLGQRRSPIAQPATPPGQPEAPGKSQGTTDGGGGNGVDGKVFEAYIVKPQELRGYRQYIKPILDKWKNSKSSLTSMEFTTLKVWYLLPLQMKPIDKETLGVSFAADQTEQLAFQTRHEVWIDSTKTAKMNDFEFAKLIIHEMVMGMYLMKFEKYSDVIKSFEKAGGKIEWPRDAITVEQSDLLLPAEPKRPLNPEDYAAIRRITEVFSQNGMNIDGDEFSRLLLVNGFDKRFFGSDAQKIKAEPIKEVTTEQMIRLLKLQESLGHRIDECRDRQAQLISDCRVNFKFEKVQAPPYFVIDRLKIVINDGKQEREFLGAISTDLTLSPSITQDAVLYEAFVSDVVTLAAKNVGDRVPMISLLFKPTRSFDQAGADLTQRLGLVGISIVQQIVTRTEDKPAPKPGEFAERCLYMADSRDRDPWQNNLMALAKGTNFTNILASHMAAGSMKPELCASKFAP